MKSKRVSVPDFDDILPTSKINSVAKSETTQPLTNEIDAIAAQSHSPIVEKPVEPSERTSLKDLMSVLLQPKEKTQEEILITSNKTLLETLASNKNTKKPEVIVEEEKEEEIVVTEIEEEKPTAEKININRLTETLKTIPKNTKGYASFEVQSETNKKEAESSNIESVKKLDKTLSEEDAIHTIKALKIWNKEPELASKVVEDHPELYYITRSNNAMKNMGNSFIVNKETGEIFIVSSVIPENLNVKKVINREIKPTY